MVTNLAEKLAPKAISTTELMEVPVKWCSVSLSEIIKGNKRLDASCFDVELKNIVSTIEKSKYSSSPICGTEGFASSYRPGICKRAFVEFSNDAIPMLTPSQVVEIHPKAEKYLAKRMKSKIENWFVNEGELLLTCSGTVGKTTIVTKTLKNQCVSQNLIRLVPRNKNDLGFLYAFMNTKAGQLLLTRNNYGAVIQHIDPEHLNKIQIPNPPPLIKKSIHDLIMRSFDLRDESNELIDYATNLLITELKLPTIKDIEKETYTNRSQVKVFSVKLSEMNGRADASFHLPVVDAIVNHLKINADEILTIGDKRISAKIILPGRFKRVYVNDGYGVVFFSGKNIMELDPSDKRYLSFSQHDKKIKNELTIKENMILVTCSGTIGKVALVPKHWNDWAMTHDIIRLVPVNDMQGYVYIWLRSEYANKLLQAYAYGSVVSHIEKFHLESIKIPLLKDKEKQKQINDIALKANTKLYEAYLLEQEALKIVNDKIIFAK